MKFKFLSLMMAIAVALAFTSCDNKGTSSASDDSDSTSSKSESVSPSASNEESPVSEEPVNEENQEDATVSNEPTGDVEADANAAGEEMLAIMTNVNTVEDLKNAEEKIQKLTEKYEGYYKSNGKMAEFEEALNKLEQDPTFSKKLQEAKDYFEKKTEEFAKEMMN